MAKTEVRAELRLDDMASATFDKIKTGFTKLDQGISGAQARLLDFAKQTAAVAIGVNIGSIFGSAKEALTGSFHAANEAQEQMRELSKTVAGMSTVSGSVEKLSQATSGTTKEVWALKSAAKGATQDFASGAENVYSRLSQIAREAGVARGELVATFSETGKNTTRTNDQLVALIGNVARAARALPAPVKDIVAGFSEIEKNTISASNPLIDMVKQANLFRGHNEQIALKLQAMGRQGMLNVMNKALKEMQERAKKMPMTLKEMGEQLGDMKTDVMKLVGEPMVSALTPAFRRLQEYIAGNRGKIEEYARTMGTKVGEWAKTAAGLVKAGFVYLQTHADEIKAALKEGFEFARKTVQWILEHKGELAAGFVATKVVSSGAVGGAVDAAKGTAEFAKALSMANAAGIGPLAAGSAGAAASLGALALAAVSVGLAIDQFNRYLKETGGFLNPAKGEAKKDLDAYMERLAEMGASYEQFSDEQVKAFDKMRQKAIDAALASDQNSRAIGEQIDAMYRQHKALADATKGFSESAKIANALPQDLGGLSDQAYADASEQQRNAAQAFADNFAAAQKGNNQAAINAGVEMLLKSKQLQQALLESGTTVGLSLEKLAEVIGDKSQEFVDKLKERAAQDRETSAAKPPPTVMQFNGGQTFNIKQDFRDQDPDRVALVFRQDVQRAAENRLQARTALPFGG